MVQKESSSFDAPECRLEGGPLRSKAIFIGHRFSSNFGNKSEILLATRVDVLLCGVPASSHVELTTFDPEELPLELAQGDKKINIIAAKGIIKFRDYGFDFDAHTILRTQLLTQFIWFLMGVLSCPSSSQAVKFCSRSSSSGQ